MESSNSRGMEDKGQSVGKGQMGRKRKSRGDTVQQGSNDLSHESGATLEKLPVATNAASAEAVMRILCAFSISCHLFIRN